MRREGAREGEPHQVPNTQPWCQPTGRRDKPQRSREALRREGVRMVWCLGRRAAKRLLSLDKYNTSH